MDSLRTGLTALAISEKRNYQVSPSFSESKSSDWRTGGTWEADHPPVQPRRQPLVLEPGQPQLPVVRQPVVLEIDQHPRRHPEQPPAHPRRQADQPPSQQRRQSDQPPAHPRRQPVILDAGHPPTQPRRLPVNLEDVLGSKYVNPSSESSPRHGFNSMELRRFGVSNTVRTVCPKSPGMIPYKQRVRNKLKSVEERNQSSDSCYSKSDNSSTASDPPRVPVHPPPSSASSSRQYDTTSLSSIDTTSSTDLWNVRAMPNVRITRLDRPVYLRPNPSTRTRPTVFDGLSDELLVNIFSYLSTKELMTSARVCRRFYFLSWEPDLWKTVNLSGEIRNVDRALSSIFQIINKNGVNIPTTVRTIYLNGCTGLTDRGLALVARRCKSLQHLHMQFCSEITNGGLLDLTSRCPELEHLDVSGCGLVSGVGVPFTPIHRDPGPSQAQRLPLQYLDMSDCARLDDTSLRLVVEACPQLQYLFLRRCSQITDGGIKSVSSYCLLLRELSVSDCPEITDLSLTELGRLGPSLRYLSLAKCEKITDLGVKNLVRHCYRLRYLNLRGLHLVTDVSIDRLSRSCTRLRSLDIGKCGITDTGLRCLSENCPNLKKLSVKGCRDVTDVGVGTLSYYCRGLQQLNIQEVDGVTVQGCRVVRSNCRRCIIEHTNPALST